MATAELIGGRAFVASGVLVGFSHAVMRVVVMAQVFTLGRRFVIAVHRHGRPAVLKRQKHEQQDGEEATHTGMLAASRFGP